MKKLADAASRRQLFKAIAVGAVSAPLMALVGKRANAGGSLGWGNGDGGKGHGGSRCLLKGTRVSTPAGERLVEDLRISDEVVTLSGPRTIKWIGYDKFTKDADRPWQARVMPIRIARSALADRAPHRDLYISPEHCIYVNGALIPVKHLVNGTSIAPEMPAGVAAIEYYHIEFDTHEVVLAEGAPIESFIEEDSQREYFSNFVEYERLYGRKQARMTPFAPILGYRNRSQKVAGLARSIVSVSVFDVRDRIQVARDQLARRAQALPA